MTQASLPLYGHAAELERVRGVIEPVIVAWCARPRLFHMTDLVLHVNAQAGPVAPDSPGRIMRDLRRRGLINVRLVNRRASLYESLAA